MGWGSIKIKVEKAWEWWAFENSNHAENQNLEKAGEGHAWCPGSKKWGIGLKSRSLGVMIEKWSVLSSRRSTGEEKRKDVQRDLEKNFVGRKPRKRDHKDPR